MAYYEQQPPPDEQPPGCLDALLIMRAVFGLLFWPLAILFAVIADLFLTAYLFVTLPWLALIPIGATVVAVWLYAQWEQRHFRPPGL